MPRKSSKASKVRVTPSSNTSNIGVAKLSSKIIETKWLNSVNIIGDGETKFSNSWTELILNLLGMLWEIEPQHFIRNLAKYKVISDGLNVTRDIVEYPVTSEISYEVYLLSKESGYYVEFHRDYRDYVRAIKGLLEALRIDKKSIIFNVISLSKIKDNIDKLNTSNSDVVQMEVEDTLYDLVSKRKEEINVVSISIFGNNQPVNSLNQALSIFLIWALSIYGENIIESGIKCNNTEVGITTSKMIDNYDLRFYKFRLGDNYVYSSSNTKAILKFIYDVAYSIGISPELITIKHKEFKLI